MANPLQFLKDLFEIAPKIKTIFSLAALAILCLFGLGIYVLVAPTPPPQVIAAGLLPAAGLFVVCIMLVRKIPPPQSPSALLTAQPKEATLTRTHLGVNNESWENLSFSLKQLEFKDLDREKKFCLIDGDYYLSWAESSKGMKLPFIQLEPQELIVSNLRKINTIMSVEIPRFLKAKSLECYVVICHTDTLHDLCCDYVASLQHLPCLLFSNSTMTQLKRRDDISVTTLKAKLAPYLH